MHFDPCAFITRWSLKEQGSRFLLSNLMSSSLPIYTAGDGTKKFFNFRQLWKCATRILSREWFFPFNLSQEIVPVLFLLSLQMDDVSLPSTRHKKLFLFYFCLHCKGWLFLSLSTLLKNCSCLFLFHCKRMNVSFPFNSMQEIAPVYFCLHCKGWLFLFLATLHKKLWYVVSLSKLSNPHNPCQSTRPHCSPFSSVPSNTDDFKHSSP